MIELKSAAELDLMRRASQITNAAMAIVLAHVRAGVRLSELDHWAKQIITRSGAVSSFQGYNGYPAFICTNVNDGVVHGVPTRRVLKRGDIVGLEIGAVFEGYHSVLIATVPVEPISEEAKELIRTARGSLTQGILQARAGCRTGDISSAMQSYAESQGYSVVREYVGCGIGQEQHQEPQLPMFGPADRGPRLRPGMTLLIIAALNQGDWRTRQLVNDWTVVTQDGSLSASFGQVVAITEGAPEILAPLPISGSLESVLRPDDAATPVASMPVKVFISYCSRDKGFVGELAPDLKGLGVGVWWDEWEIKVGDSITEKINRGISESSFLLIVLSPNSVGSRWVQKELNAALMRELDSRHVFVLPLLLADCDIPAIIRDKKYADFRTSYDQGLHELLDVLSPSK